MKSRRLIVLSSLAVLIFAASAVLSGNLTKPALKIDKQNSVLNFNDQFLKIGFAGYKRLVADVMWISTLLESDQSHYKKKDLNNWMFLRFNSIAQMDPNFFLVYDFGGQYLSIIKDDLNGAEKIFKKGLENFPDSYSLNYNLGFLYAFELGEPEASIKFFSKIKDHPKAPNFLPSLFNKLKYQKHQDLQLAFSMTLETYNNANDPFLKQKLWNDLYSIKATMDLKCLNEEKNECEKTDLNGEKYIYSNGIYRSKKKFRRYRFHQKKAR